MDMKQYNTAIVTAEVSVFLITEAMEEQFILVSNFLPQKSNVD